MIKAMIFDLGKTLIHSKRSNSFQMRLKELGVERDDEDIRMAFEFSDKYFMAMFPGELGQSPKVFYPKYLDIMLSYLHICTIDKMTLYENIFRLSPPRSGWVPYEETVPFLEELHRRGLKVGLLTNWDLGARKLLAEVGIDKYLDSIVVSSEINAEKPDKKGFLISLENLDLKPEEAIYCGDNYFDDVVGANSVGMKGALLNRSPFEEPQREGDYVTVKTLTELLDIFR